MNASAIVREDSTGPADHLVGDANFNLYDEDAAYSSMRAGENGTLHLTKKLLLIGNIILLVMMLEIMLILPTEDL